MIARYLPDMSLSGWFMLLSRGAVGHSKAPARFIEKLDVHEVYKNNMQVYCFQNGRQGIHAFFRNLQQRRGKGTVVLSSQICRVVPQLIKQLGFTLRFVDIDTSYPSPSPAQFLEAVDDTTVCIVIAPVCGYMQYDWSTLFENLKDIDVFLDLAQGLLLENNLPELMFEKASAAVYSFSVGKGLDSGGGMLFTRFGGNMPEYSRAGKIHFFAVFLQCLLLRAAISTGLYPFLIRYLESAMESQKEFKEMRDADCYSVPEDIFILWEEKLRHFELDVKRARARARAIKNLLPVQQHCRDISVYCDEKSVFLRQILRLKDAARRDSVLCMLRRAVDCIPAGETLPGEYLAEFRGVRFPNAELFRKDALHLPFLGRLNEKQFKIFQRALQDALQQSH